MRSFSRLSRHEQRKVIAQIRDDLNRLCDYYKSIWTPVDPSWEIVDGAAYIRLSTPDQFLVEKGSVEQQVHISVDEALARSRTDRVNYRIVEFFIELPITGKSEHRPQLERLERAIGKRKIRFVVLKELARIFRESSLWKKFFRHSQSNECEIMIRSFPFNPNDPTQILQLDILAAFAEYESNVNSKRGKESHFSAMRSSGKFNSTHKVLGLDQLVIDGAPKVGLYTVNSKEMKTVVWIFETFVKYGSYQVTLAEIDKSGVTNKNGKPFKRHSLFTLLTNTKYIGEWEVNVRNRAKNQAKLMPYERYEKVSLPHGCVIDMDLWNRAQETVARLKGSKDKNTKLDRQYLLSGLLQFADGSSFQGTGSWGRSKTHRSNYYYNKANAVRLKAEDVELEAKQMAVSALSQSKAFQDALRQRLQNAKTRSELLAGEAGRIEDLIRDLEQQRDAINRRMDFLLAGNAVDQSADVAALKSQFLKEHREVQHKIQQHQANVANITDQRRVLESKGVSVKALLGNAGQVVRLIEENEPVALKNAYKLLFDRVIVGGVNDKGSRPLTFLFKDQFSESIEDFENFVNRTDGTSVERKLAQAVRPGQVIEITLSEKLNHTTRHKAHFYRLQVENLSTTDSLRSPS